MVKKLCLVALVASSDADRGVRGAARHQEMPLEIVRDGSQNTLRHSSCLHADIVVVHQSYAGLLASGCWLGCHCMRVVI